MSTNCKLIFGYTDHTGWWNETEAYYRHYDGYTEAIIPLLEKFGDDVTSMNLEAEYDGHKWEKLDGGYEGGRTDFVYYIDNSDHRKIRCTVLKSDLEFYKRFGVDNYIVFKELVL